MKNKPSYGIDAPGVIRLFLFIAAVIILLSQVFPELHIGAAVVQTRYFIWTGLYFLLVGVLMLLYSLWGKYHHRDRMLKLVPWTGDEAVLDVGTGKGLLMIGAAKKLTSGLSTGIDIWKAKDLSDNNAESTLHNARLEGVETRVSIKTEDVTQLSFPENTFNTILSNLCLHNIPNRAGRDKACQEIARVLKPGGIAIIADFKNIRQYKKQFDALGFETQLIYSSFFASFPPLTILKAVKAG
jgi:arsenite methyltransferase